MKSHVSALALLVGLLPAAAHANSIYADCPVAPTTFGTVWHVDPVNGASPANGGDGSAAHPWDSLQGVLSWNTQNRPAGWTRPAFATLPYDHHGVTPNGLGPNGIRVSADGVGYDPAQVQPGDEVLLATGNYGDITLSEYMQKIANVDPATGATKFVTFAAEPGAAPVFKTLVLNGAVGFNFQHITVQSTRTDGSALNSGDLVLVSDGGPSFPTRDIIFANGTLRSASAMPTQINPDGSYLSGWAQAQWAANARSGFVVAGSDGASTHCVTVQNNTIKFVNQGGSVSQANEVAFIGNFVDYFIGDGFDNYSNSYAQIVSNLIEDSVDSGNGTHRDCGQLAFVSNKHSTVDNPWHDVVYSGNLCIRLAHADNPFPGYLQGNPFHTNDFYDRLTVTNNKMVSAACVGITVRANHSLVANNTIVRDGSPGIAGCSGLSIDVEGDSTTTAANNVVTGGFVQAADDVVWKNNLAVPSYAAGVIAHQPNYLCLAGVCGFYSGAGTLNGVTYDTTKTDLVGVFTAYAPPAIGIASPTSPNLTPAVGGLLDQTGAYLGKMPNIGAF